MHFIQAKRNLEKHFPGAKFIILKHPQDLIDPNNDNIKSQFFNSNLWKELEQEGFIVIDLEEYVGGNLLTKEYLLPDGHPNAKLWEVVSKKLIKDFNM